MNSQQTNINNLFQGANTGGLLSGASLAVLTAPAVCQQIANGFGISTNDIESSEIFGVHVLVDDSGSIAMRGNTQKVIDAFNHYREQMLKAQNVDDMIVSVTTLNGKTICDYLPMEDVPLLSASNYVANGGTPLYDEVIKATGGLVARQLDARKSRKNFKGMLIVITDGNDEASKAGALTDCKNLLDDILMREGSPFLVMMLAIEDGRTDFRQVGSDMGIPANWVKTGDANDLRAAMGLASRVSKSASQVSGNSLGALSSLGLGGLGNI